MKFKTSNLSGDLLDLAVAVAVGEKNPQISFGGGCVVSHGHTLHRFYPSSEWQHGGPLIEAHSPVITICHAKIRTEISTLENDVSTTGIGLGLTYLESFCRALVSLKLGDEVDITDGLIDPKCAAGITVKGDIDDS